MTMVSRIRAASAAILGLLVGLAATQAARAQSVIADHDSSQPIEIAAEELTVRQRDQVATFTGEVQAIQGQLTLSADELRVSYDIEGEGEQPAGAQAIRRIEAQGNVLITAPDETASGDEGFYDIVEGRIVLEGEVVLTQEDNVIEGGRLEIDLNQSVARMQAGPTTAAAGERRRVRAVFVPASGGTEEGDVPASGGAESP